MRKKTIRSQADAHELALNAVSASRRKLRVGKASAEERAVIQRSHERGDTDHCKVRLS
jgi:hypothetical protein